MKIKALERSVHLPEKVEPNTCTLSVHANGPNSPAYRAVHMHWHEFQQLLARNGNQELRGNIHAFAIHPNQQEIHFYPIPAEGADAVFRYSPVMRQI